MRILSIVRVWPSDHPGGMPAVARDRALALAQEHEVFVLTTSCLSGIDEPGITVNIAQVPFGVYSTQFAEEGQRFCKRLKPDIVHLDSFDSRRPWWHEQPAPVVVTMHGFTPGGLLTSWSKFRLGQQSQGMPVWPGQVMLAEARILERAHRVLAVSRFERWQLADIYGLKNAQLVYNPIHSVFFSSEPPPVNRSAPLLCVRSRGTDSGRLFDWAVTGAKRAGRRLRLVSGVPRESMPGEYDRSSAFVLPTIWCTGYDLTVAEALARQRPVIISDTGTYHWESYGAWVVKVPVGDLQAMWEAMSSELPFVPKCAAKQHRPEVHAQNWLQAINV